LLTVLKNRERENGFEANKKALKIWGLSPANQYLGPAVGKQKKAPILRRLVQTMSRPAKD
jgi:hypothetical protein